MTRAAVAVLALCVGLSAAQEPLTPEARKKALLEGTHVFRRIRDPAIHSIGFREIRVYIMHCVQIRTHKEERIRHCSSAPGNFAMY